MQQQQPLPVQAPPQPAVAAVAPPQPAVDDDPWAGNLDNDVGALGAVYVRAPTWCWSRHWMAWLHAPPDWQRRTDGEWALNEAYNVWVWFHVPAEYRRRRRW